MEFYNIIDKRRTIRDFSDKPVPKDKVLRILEAGLKAPTYNHLREWDFILIENKSVRLDIVAAEKIPEKYEIDELKKIFMNHDAIAKEMYFNALPKQKRMILSAPELLIVVFKPKTTVLESKRVYDLNCLSSVWCCIENILLAMAEENLFGVTFVPQYTDDLKKTLNVPDNLEIAAIIPFGYKSDYAGILRQKGINLKEKIHFNKW